MLEITIPEQEAFDESTNRFIKLKGMKLSMEHSLVSIYKWESKWHKPFLHSTKTNAEVLDYIRCMTITQNVPDDVYYRIPQSEIDKIQAYIEDSRKRKREIVTAEIIYYWMVSANVPFECQKWHLNKLLTLLQVISEKNKPPKKMSKSQIAKQYAALNAARKAKLHTRG